MGVYAPIEVGVEAYVIRGGKLLLGHRKNVFGDGTWGLPGGRIELMERARAAVIREVKEELGIALPEEAANLIAVTDDPDPAHGTHHLHISFRVDIGDQEPTLAEPDACSEWRWFELGKLPKALFPPHARVLHTIDSGRPYL